MILEGKWLERILGWKLGDQIAVEFREGNEVALKKIETH